MSTSHALVLDDITKSLENKKYALGVFIDLKKAFDTVDHQLLCRKLGLYIRGIAHNWITNYLDNRSQFVSIDGYSSDIQAIKCGVPQGSILGPKLFILYVNDICNLSKLEKFIFFADDTNMLCSANDVEQLENNYCVLGKLQLWFSINKLSFNVAKTNYMLFSGRTRVPGINMRIKYTQITRVRVTKCLGVLIDESLNWKDPTSRFMSKLSISVGIMYRCSKLLEYHSMYMLYSTPVLPYPLYCVETYSTHLLCIIMWQKRVMRLMHNAQRCDHTTPLFYKSHILKFVDLIKFRTILFMFKTHINELSSNFQRLFVKHTNKHCTRRKNLYTRTCASINRMAMSLIMYGTKLWNSLNVNMAHVRSFNYFKAHFRRQLLDINLCNADVLISYLGYFCK